MRAFNWILRLVLFLLLFGLALNNLEPTVLHLLFGVQWSAPLFVLLLAAFSIGALLGAIAMLPALLRARRRQPRAQAPQDPPPPPRAAAIDGAPDGV
jgi:uncharacterized integral membrane protein